MTTKEKFAATLYTETWEESNTKYPGIFKNEQEWEAARKEYINMPDISKAPPYAKWLAQDGAGHWIYYNEKPIIDERKNQWYDPYVIYSRGLEIASYGNIPKGHDWEDSLTKIK